MAKELNRHLSKEDIQIINKHMKTYSTSADQTYNEISPHTRMAIIKKSTNNKFWRGCGEKRTLINYWKVNWCSHYGKQYGGSFKN